MATTLDEIKERLRQYKSPIHRGNYTAQRYVEAVEFLLAALSESDERQRITEELLEVASSVE